MIETYAFLAMFALQILAGSVLCPALFVRRIRADPASFPIERLAKLFPGIHKSTSTGRFLARYRAQNIGIAVLGLLILGWLFIRMQRPGLNEVIVVFLICAYLVLQTSPQVRITRKLGRYYVLLNDSLANGKRKAVLQRRGFFEFISPRLAFLAVLSYLLFAALVLYARQHPYPGFTGSIYLGAITLVYALSAISIFVSLYGRRPKALLSHGDRIHAIGMSVRIWICTCIGLTVFVMLDLTLALLNLTKWSLFELSVFCVICVMSPYIWGEIARRRPTGRVLGSGGSLPPGTGNLSV
ncbi:MAG TPA: hypothetical protein VGV09_12250 [Steroidobacteraceae bacterium]|nr:hypothetical protein [Steroidobacteraceae bacterium]